MTRPPVLFDEGERIGRYRFVGIRPLGVRVVSANPDPKALPHSPNIVPGRKARSLAEAWGLTRQRSPYAGSEQHVTRKDQFSPSQLDLLSKLLDGPIRLYGAQWQAFRSLEARGLAVKIDMQVFISDLGRQAYHNREEGK